MTVTAERVAPTEIGATYIRGGAGVRTTDGNVGRWTAWFVLFTMLAWALGLFGAAIRHDVQVVRLHRHGVAVTATASSCLAIASGTGITQAGFTCKASYGFDGARYTEVVHNTLLQFQPGQRIDAVVDPAHPTTISYANSVKSTSGLWEQYVTPVLLLIGVVLGMVWMSVRRKRG